MNHEETLQDIRLAGIRSKRIDANLAQCHRLLSEIRTQRWRFFRNAERRAEIEGLLRANEIMLDLNEEVIKRNAEHLS